MNEHDRALMEGHEIAASNAYFSARPQIDTNDSRKVFEAGFKAAWNVVTDNASGKPTPPEADCARAAARWDVIETLMILGDVELTQTEGGGYRIFVEPVENTIPTAWEGDTPEQAADMVVAQLNTPNSR